MERVMSRDDVFAAINDEADFQDKRWGADKEQSLAGYFLIMEQKLNDAKVAWMKDKAGGGDSPLAELLKVVTVGVRALEAYGDRGNVICSSDTPVVEYDLPPGWRTLELTGKGGQSVNVDPHSVICLTHADPTSPAKGSILTVRYAGRGDCIGKLAVSETVAEIQQLVRSMNPDDADA